MYLIALASRAPLELPGAISHLDDAGLELLRAAERATNAVRAEAAASFAEAHALRKTLQERGDDLRRAAKQLENARSDADGLLAQLGVKEQELRDLDDLLTQTRADVADDLDRLRRVDESVTWQTFERVRGRLYGSMGGRASLPGRALQWTLRAAGRRTLPPAPVVEAPVPEPAVAPIRFPRVEHPRVSILIPVHARPDLTEACLRSIAEHTDGPTYEVIVVDDRAPDHGAIWNALENATVVHNEDNEGYVRNNNIGAREARGEFLLLLNNDTEVAPGWLTPLVARADSAADIGVVVPKLLYPVGRPAGGGRHHLQRRDRLELRPRIATPRSPSSTMSATSTTARRRACSCGATSGETSAASTSVTSRCTTRTLTCASRCARPAIAWCLSRAPRSSTSRAPRRASTSGAATSASRRSTARSS